MYDYFEYFMNHQFEKIKFSNRVASYTSPPALSRGEGALAPFITNNISTLSTLLWRGVGGEVLRKSDNELNSTFNILPLSGLPTLTGQRTLTVSADLSGVNKECFGNVVTLIF